ncbi:MAG: glycosyltransferase family 39 protein [Clostridia bacterium]
MDFNTLLLLFVLAICGFALFRRPTRDWKPLKLMNDKQFVYRIIIIVLMLLAIFLRVYKFGMVPGGMNQDGVMAAVDANALANHGTDRFGMSLPVFFTSWGYGQMSVLLSYLMVPFIKIFGLSVITARLPILIVSVIAIFILFKLVEKLFGKTPALVVLAFIAINPWQIMQSRWAIDCNMLPHFLLFSVYFLYLGLSKKKYLYLSMIFFGLTMYTYGIAFYSIPIMLIVLCAYLLITHHIKIMDALACLGFYLLVAWPILTVIVINFFKLKTVIFGPLTMAFFPYTMRTNDILFFSDNFFDQLIVNLKSLIDVVFLQKEGLIWNAIPQFGALYLITMPFVLLGFYYLIKKLRKTEKEEKSVIAGRYLIIVWFLVAVLSGIIINNVNLNRINIILYPMCIFAALGIYYALFEALRNRFIALVILFAFTFSTLGFSYAYFGQTSKVLAQTFFDGFGSAIQTAENTKADTVYVTNFTQYKGSYHVSEILTQFYAKTDALYFQGKGKGFDNSGKELLPYRDRYKYTNFDTNVTPDPTGVYVINLVEKAYFAPKNYTIKIYGGFGVAIPKK